MADYISRIRLETQGGDGAAKEVRKVRDAYESTRTTVQETNKAVQEGAKTVEDSARSQEHTVIRSMQTMQRATFAHMMSSAGGTIANTVNQLSSGNVVGAFGSTMQGVGGALSMMGMPIIGAVASLAGVAANTISNLASKEESRFQQIYGGGLSQQLMSTYETTRDYILRLGVTGVNTATSHRMLSAFAGQGGRLSEQAIPGLNYAADMAQNMGISPDVLGEFLGISSILNYQNVLGQTGTRSPMSRIYGMMLGSFEKYGPAGMQNYLQAINNQQQMLMTRGVAAQNITEAGMIAGATQLAGYTSLGGLTPQGGVALYQLANQRAMAAGAVQQPEDVVALNAVRTMYPGLSVTDAMALMESRPDLVNQVVYSHIVSTAGNRDVANLMAKRYLGGTTSQAKAWLDTQKALSEGKTPIQYGDPDQIISYYADINARVMQGTLQAPLLAGAEKAFAKLSEGVKLGTLERKGIFVTPDARTIPAEAGRPDRRLKIPTVGGNTALDWGYDLGSVISDPSQGFGLRPLLPGLTALANWVFGDRNDKDKKKEDLPETDPILKEIADNTRVTAENTRSESGHAPMSDEDYTDPDIYRRMYGR